MVAEAGTRVETEVPVLIGHFRTQTHGHIGIGTIEKVAVVAVECAITVAVDEGMRNDVSVLIVYLTINVEGT